MRVVPLFLLLVPLLPPAPAQEPWREPPPEIVAALDERPTPEARLSPDGRWLLLVGRPAMPPLADVMRPWIGLAGVRVDVAAGARQLIEARDRLTLVSLEDGERREVETPAGARIADVSWSHTGRSFAFTVYGDSGVDLWVAEPGPSPARRVAGPLAAVLGRGFDWTPDGLHLLAFLVPPDRGRPPERPPVPPGPIVQETSGAKAPLRTYQDLLADEHDEALFDFYATAQLAVVGPDDGAVRTLGPPGVYAMARFSPDGQHLLVARIERPYSFLVRHERFPRALEVWDANGSLEATLARLPLAEEVPIGGVAPGPRMAQWVASEPATLAWVEALDGGDPEVDVPARDHWVRWEAPFTGERTELARVEHRATGIRWMPAPGQFVTSEYDRDRRWTRELLHGRGAEPVVLDDRSVRDRYGDPGDLATRLAGNGARVVRSDGDVVWRTGQGASPEGARPFLARVDLARGTREVVWRAAPGSYEYVVGLVATGTERAASFVTRYESPREPPSFRLRDLSRKTVTALTQPPEPSPLLRGIEKRLVTYQREDGVHLSAELYLPADRPEGQRLPLFVWAYPIEYNDPGTAGQYSGSPYRFPRVAGASPILLATRGWAVMMNATMPVVGDPETVNDTFIEQIVASARAAIDRAAALGVADPARTAVGGHSYGAFMAANLLANSDLFRAGIARSGAYNRTLTPFGFQSERRTLWQAPELYYAVSPFLHADRIDEPLLLIHGQRDPNPGTFPIQSDRLFHAIVGNGGTARYVKLPGEGHGYRARESVLQVVAETFDWLDRYVAHPPETDESQDGGD